MKDRLKAYAVELRAVVTQKIIRWLRAEGYTVWPAAPAETDEGNALVDGLMNARTKGVPRPLRFTCDTLDGPCACGAWHLEDRETN